ncbi:type II toxin-antitoxin system PemK/MazF family toxin [Candidatus Pacearchaeota archaeon]|nr:type II toxin-antitoxin system PemK/MazF family toxin [Candidatus Pacearchaeota archaeon]
MYNQMDIVLIPFPYSNLTGSKRRPAIIISNEKLNKMQDRICCLVTTKAHKDDLEITKNSFVSGSLPFKSFVKPHRIFTINEEIVIKKLCTISSDFHDKIIARLNDYVKRN